jgi:hypothetical protein
MQVIHSKFWGEEAREKRRQRDAAAREMLGGWTGCFFHDTASSKTTLT